MSGWGGGRRREKTGNPKEDRNSFRMDLSISEQRSESSPADNISHRTIVVDKNGPATYDSRTDVDRFIGPDPKQI